MAQVFSCFPNLPKELREIVFSVMGVSEWIQMSRASCEAFEYMKEHKFKSNTITLYVDESDGIKSVNINIEDKYEEKHKLNEEMTNVLSTEFSSYVDCECCWCTDRIGLGDTMIKRSPTTVVHRDWETIDKLFYVMQIVDFGGMGIMTEPYGGFIESVEPGKRFNRELECIDIVLHQKKSDTERTLDLKKWASWIEFTGTENVQMRTPVLFTDPLFMFGSEVIDADFLNCEPIRDACSVHIEAKMEVNIDQDWIRDPTMRISYRILVDGEEDESVDHWCMVELIVSQSLTASPAVLNFVTGGMNNYKVSANKSVVWQIVSTIDPNTCITNMLNSDDVELGADFLVHHDFDCFLNMKRHALTVHNLQADTVLLVDQLSITSVEKASGREIEWPLS